MPPSEAEPPLEAAPPTEAAPPPESGGDAVPGTILTREEMEAEDDLFAETETEPEPPATDEVHSFEDFSEDATAESFQLQPPGPRPSRPPPVFGPNWLTFGPILGRGAIGLGVSYVRFVIPHLGVGADIEDVVYFGGDVINFFHLTPKVTLMMLPYRRFSPLVQTGIGFAALSAGVGVYARWMAGLGFAMAFNRFSMRIGADVWGLMPDSTFAQRVTCPLVSTPCSLGISPWIAVGRGF
ncbi:hypothetical protein [Paraliomyxa miuraensis]|uniref:hypothetical protein n=1 Tax=Paraliomyxa miuraensis TaxID=376150 RepID=UPI0022550CD3|nr:hypothetical protein [Paraliomyxa miuraensis]MCX4242401.1 hypothetical protein [Paraliomyxa miuraensis]